MINKKVCLIFGLIVLFTTISSQGFSQPAANSDERLPIDSTHISRHHAVSLKTNLLFDAFYMPHIGMAPMPDVELEFFTRGGHLSFVAGFTFPYWKDEPRHKYFQIRDYRLEARWYFGRNLPAQKANTGFFLGLGGNYNEYGIGLSKRKGWQGEGWGGGMNLGFAHRLCRSGRWRLEYNIGAGYYETRFDPYVFGNPVTGATDGDYYYDYTGPVKDFHRRNHRRRWFGPTSVGITLSYDLFYFKAQKKGLGTHRTEMLQAEAGRKEAAQ